MKSTIQDLSNLPRRFACEPTANHLANSVIPFFRRHLGPSFKVPPKSVCHLLFRQTCCNEAAGALNNSIAGSPPKLGRNQLGFISWDL
jgi:hypothetical protein